MPDTNLGKVSIRPMGEYNPETQYEELDIVTYQGSSYLSLEAVQGVLPADGSKWMIIALKGNTGDAGADGVQTFEKPDGGTAVDESGAAMDGNIYWAV